VAAVRAEAADAVVVRELGARQLRLRHADGGRPGWHGQARRYRASVERAAQLTRERALVGAQHHAGGARQELALSFAQLPSGADEHAAALVARRARAEVTHGVGDRPRAGARRFVEDDQIAREAIEAPELVREQHVTAELSEISVIDAAEHDRQIARDALP